MGGNQNKLCLVNKQISGVKNESNRALTSIIPVASGALLGLVLLPLVSYAGPENGNIVGGSDSISQTDLTTTIQQNTERLAIDWDSFNVAVDERVQLIQPSFDSVA